MKMVAKRCVFLAILFLGSDLCALEIPVIVQEPAGIAREAEPVSGGTPLPEGVYKPGRVDLALYDGDRPVPAQLVEHVVGPGGFVRWVLLDFHLNLEANESKRLVLKEGPAVGPDVELKVQDSAASVRVDTGKLVFHVSRNEPFGFLQDVSVKGRSVMARGRVSCVDGLTNKEYTAEKPQLVKVHYPGPLRVTIEVRGRFRNDTTAPLGYCTYITAWANRSDVLVRHSLINSRQDQRYVVQVKGSRIELKPLDASGVVLVGADKTLSASSGTTVMLHQGLEERRNRSLPSGKVGQDGRIIWEGRGAQGWISKGRIWAADRLFRTDPPRSLGVAKDGTLILDAAPALFQGLKANNTIIGRPWACQDDYRWLYDCSALSSEYRIDFDAPQDSDQLQAKAPAAAARLRAFAPGAWYSRCNVLGVGRFGTLEDEAACHAKWNWTGQRLLLDKGRKFWSFGNRRRYQTTGLTKTHHFANHIPPKDDSVLSTVRLFHESIHPGQDREPPEPIDDLAVRLSGQGAASVRFSAPSDKHGRVIKYQVKVSPLPIVPYEQWEYSRDSSRKRNWWRAVNCKGEPNPKAPGAVEEFVITNLPDSDNGPLYFAVRSFDDSQNQSEISNVFKVE